MYCKKAKNLNEPLKSNTDSPLYKDVNDLKNIKFDTLKTNKSAFAGSPKVSSSSDILKIGHFARFLLKIQNYYGRTVIKKN